MPTHRPLRVLIVEDNQDGADSTADLLTLLGHAVQVARSGKDAEKVVGSFSPDMVLLDIGLPGDDGYTVAKKLCDLLERKPIIVAVTGFPHFKDRSEREGFDHHYLKPVDPCELAKLLSEYAGKLNGHA